MNSLNLNDPPQFNDPKYNTAPEVVNRVEPVAQTEMLTPCPACGRSISTNAAAARYLGISPTTLRKSLRYRGKINFVKWNSTIRYLMSDWAGN
jgi:hypothetical protein